MKRTSLIWIISFLVLATGASAQKKQYSAITDSTGLPGDHFSLQGALELFKQSSTPEEFEKNLNTEKNYVNNLDLNEDGKTDYIKVINKKQGTSHAIILQALVSKTESQDVAVIAIEKNNDKSAILQIVGDASLYGDSAIVEPVMADGEKSKGSGPEAKISSLNLFFVNVWYWPCVTYIYQPYYVVYVSPWYWDYFPFWWSSWYIRPWYWHHHYCHSHYYGYHPVHYYTVNNAMGMYYTHRTTSASVNTRYTNAHQQYKAYKATGSFKTANSASQSGMGKQNINGQVGKSNTSTNKPVIQNEQKTNGGLQSKPQQNNYQKPVNSYDSKPSQHNSNSFDRYNHQKPGVNTYQGKTQQQNSGKYGSYDRQKPTQNSYQNPQKNINSGKANNISSKPQNIQSKPGNTTPGGGRKDGAGSQKQQPGKSNFSTPSNNGRSR